MSYMYDVSVIINRSLKAVTFNGLTRLNYFLIFLFSFSAIVFNDKFYLI